MCSLVFLADSLIEMGEVLRQMADVKYSLDDNIKQNFLEPLHHLQTKDLKEVMVCYLQSYDKLIHKSYAEFRYSNRQCYVCFFTVPYIFYSIIVRSYKDDA